MCALLSSLIFSAGTTHAAVLSLGDGGDITYDIEEVREGMHRYYREVEGVRTIVATMQDVDLDGDGDVWRVFKDGVAILEARDEMDLNVPTAFYVIEYMGTSSATQTEESVPADTTLQRYALLAIMGIMLIWMVYRTDQEQHATL